MAEPPRLFIALYTDEDVTSELAPALRDRGFEAQSAAEAGLLNQGDPVQLAHAVEHNMAILTCNADHFLALAQLYTETSRPHAGIIVSSEQFSRRRFGELLRLLNTMTADELRDGVIYLQQFR